MSIKTKIEREELYKADYDKIAELIPKILAAEKALTVRGIGSGDMKLIADIYSKYRPKEIINLNCSACVIKIISFIAKMVRKYGKKDETS